MDDEKSSNGGTNLQPTPGQGGVVTNNGNGDTPEETASPRRGTQAEQEQRDTSHSGSHDALFPEIEFYDLELGQMQSIRVELGRILDALDEGEVEALKAQAPNLANEHRTTLEDALRSIERYLGQLDNMILFGMGKRYGKNNLAVMIPIPRGPTPPTPNNPKVMVSVALYKIRKVFRDWMDLNRGVGVFVPCGTKSCDVYIGDTKVVFPDKW